jgi:SAM-dependent methyltransferase
MTLDESKTGGFGWLTGVLPARPARILDAGCGAGALASWLSGRGYEVTAIDIDSSAVATAEAAGIPAICADLASYHDEPFDAIVMRTSLHHMYALAAALDRAAALMRPGGMLVLDEFAWDWADKAAASWFYDIAAILNAAGLIGTWAGTGDPLTRWRVQHTEPGGDSCHRGEEMIEAVSARFGEVSVHRVPYLSYYLASELGNEQIAGELHRIEHEKVTDGTLPATGFRLTARNGSLTSAIQH